MTALAVVAPKACFLGCGVLKKVVGWSLGGAGNSIGSGFARAIGGVIFKDLTAWILAGAAWVVAQAMKAIGGSTVSLQSAWFLNRETAMLEVSGLVLVPLMCIAAIRAVARQDLHALGRTFGVGLPVAAIGATCSIVVVKWLLALVNQLSALITVGQQDGPFVAMFRRLTDAGIPGFMQALFALVIVFCGLLLWLEMVLRTTAIYLVAFFLPLGFACFVWPATVTITKRFASLLVAVIGSKFVIVAVLSMASAISGSSGGPAGPLITGVAVLMLACGAPFALLKTLPLVEGAALAHMEGLSRRPLHAGWRMAGLSAGGANRIADLAGSASAGHAFAPGEDPGMMIQDLEGTWSDPGPDLDSPSDTGSSGGSGSSGESGSSGGSGSPGGFGSSGGSGDRPGGDPGSSTSFSSKAASADLMSDTGSGQSGHGSALITAEPERSTAGLGGQSNATGRAWWEEDPDSQDSPDVDWRSSVPTIDPPTSDPIDWTSDGDDD